MMDQLASFIVNESKWLPISMSLAFLAIAILLFRHRQSDLSTKQRVMAAMNLFFGITIATMAFGHLSAVTTKLLLGTLKGSIPFLYAIGIALSVPSWWLIFHTRTLLTAREDRKRTLTLNIWLAVTLAVLGITNLPLAAPALFNIGYYLHSRRNVGWAIVIAAVVLQLGLFVGSLIFFASGQSFEEFSRMQ